MSADENVEPVANAPFLKVVSPDATPEEIAALVAVLASLGGGAEASPKRRTPEWQAHHRKVRANLPHGPGGWRSSALPR
ncbi:MAG TPA: acyl-CoA carboxylase subunit epsilon [Nocardioides sp.]|nr:acyl-CoA carboxylase subunit epsilon [Nocardioides sp.]